MRNNDSGGERLGLNRIGTKRDKALALFDALLDAPEGSSASCDGTLVKALQDWAKARGVGISRDVLSLPSRSWECFAARVDGRTVVAIHLNAPPPPGDDLVRGTWRPTDAAESR